MTDPFDLTAIVLDEWHQGMVTEILVKHRESGLIKKDYYEFSWTYWFFGWFVP